jgi:hypothetical protein
MKLILPTTNSKSTMKISALLEDHSESVGCKTLLLMKNVSLFDEVYQQL